MTTAFNIPRKLYELRRAAGLTQSELASRMGTAAPVISRWEDSAYTGHSLSTLRRIAWALGHELEIRFVPVAAQREDQGSCRTRQSNGSTWTEASGL